MKATIDDELKKRGVVDHVFYETSALTGQNLDEFKTLFGMCFLWDIHAFTPYVYVDIAGSHLQCV